VEIVFVPEFYQRTQCSFKFGAPQDLFYLVNILVVNKIYQRRFKIGLPKMSARNKRDHRI
jgi:hypothetical protein